MKRLLRWLFNLAAGVSLTLFVLIGVFWVRSYWIGDAIEFRRCSQLPRFTQYETCSLRQAYGTVQLNYQLTGQAFILRKKFVPGLSLEHSEPQQGAVRIYTPIWGTHSLNPQSTSGWYVVLPDWILLIVFGVMPAIAGMLWRRDWSRKRHGQCLHCGYDLRASPGRCPECGAISTAVATSAK